MPAALRLASVSVDLDPLRCYHQIHGLGEAPAELADVVLRRGLPRFLELFAQHGIRATLFVVGSDVTEHRGAPDPIGRVLLAEAARAGHELGNHSFSHPYGLARLPDVQIEREIGDCHEALRQLDPHGRAPVGFRAPGYELSPALLDILDAYGYRYDSSILPCPPYYLAKLAVLAKMAVFGQRSESIVGTPEAQFGPTQPYRPDPRRPWKKGGASFVELPVAVTKTVRMPAIGTSLILSSLMRKALLYGMRDQPFFNLELHGMDLIGAQEDRIPAALVARQPDLRVPFQRKLLALAESFRFLTDHAEVATLRDVAEEVHARGKVDPR